MQKPGQEKPLVVSIPETGRLLDLGRTSIYALIKDGDLKSIKIRNRHLIIRASITDLIQRRANTPA